MIRLEIVISIWDDGLYKSRARGECEWHMFDDTIEKLATEIEAKLLKVEEEHNKKYEVTPDDDIPF